MMRHFVTRADQVEHIRRLMESGASGSVVVTGHPGIGRTTFLKRVIEFADPVRDEVIVHVPPVIRHPDYPAATPDMETVRYAERIAERGTPARRLIIAVDDAHLMDYSSLLAFKRLACHGGALLIATRPSASSRLNKADPTTVLAQERDTRMVSLVPLCAAEVAEMLAAETGATIPPPVAEAVHAATAGNPGLLKNMVSTIGIPMVSDPQENSFSSSSEQTEEKEDAAAYLGRDQLISATREAWRECAFGRSELLCRLALRCGGGEEVAPIWATLLLLRGQTKECLAFLEAQDRRDAMPVQLALIHALALAFGCKRIADANDLLRIAAADSPDTSALCHAFRAWLLAAGGCLSSARNAITDSVRGDHATALFIHAASAVISDARGQHAESVFHLRRAITSAETAGDDFPWIRPYLQASLIGSLTLCGRAKEATSIAQRFHAHDPASGWSTAASLSVLMSGSGATSGLAREDQGDACRCLCRRAQSSGRQRECARFHTRSCELSELSELSSVPPSRPGEILTPVAEAPRSKLAPELTAKAAV